jgi:hypothetical protein
MFFMHLRPLLPALLVVVIGLSGFFIIIYRYDAVGTRVHTYETMMSEISTLTKVETIQSYSIFYETTNAVQIVTLLRDTEGESVGGGDALGYGYGLGRLQVGDIVIVDISSVYKVLLCLDKPPKDEYGWFSRDFYFDCEYAYVTDEGHYEMKITKDGPYTLMVGKQAGYYVTSFILTFKVVRQEEGPLVLTKTAVLTVTTTYPVIVTTSYTTTILSTETYTTNRGLLG